MRDRPSQVSRRGVSWRKSAWWNTASISTNANLSSGLGTDKFCSRLETFLSQLPKDFQHAVYRSAAKALSSLTTKSTCRLCPQLKSHKYRHSTAAKIFPLKSEQTPSCIWIPISSLCTRVRPMIISSPQRQVRTMLEQQGTSPRWKKS